MSGGSTFDIEKKKQKQGKFKTPPRPTGRRSKNDFSKFKYLPSNWLYNLDDDGNGTAVDFTLKAKPILLWSPKTFLKTDKGMVEAKRFPIEKVCLTMIR